MSPVRNQPSASTPPSIPQYPFITLWPRMAISPSTSFISTPSTGSPIEPGLRSRSRRLNDAIGDVSDSP